MLMFYYINKKIIILDLLILTSSSLKYMFLILIMFNIKKHQNHLHFNTFCYLIVSYLLLYIISFVCGIILILKYIKTQIYEIWILITGILSLIPFSILTINISLLISLRQHLQLLIKNINYRNKLKN